MSRRTITIVLLSLVGVGALGGAAYLAFRDRLAPPHPPEGPKKETDDHAAAADDAEDAKLFKAAPVSLSADASDSGVQRGRAAVLRGRVLSPDGQPLEKVQVHIDVDKRPVFQKTTRADGGFDLPVNGGGPLVVLYDLKGYLSARRPVAVPWQDYVVLPDVVLAPAPARIGALDVPLPATLPGAAPSVRVAAAGADADRQAAFVAPPGFAAAPLKGKLTLSFREYTAGPRDAALPAPAPPGAGCVYAFELTAEEAHFAGDRGLPFSPSLAHYVDNFLKLPVGTELPTYRYDAAQLRWAPGPVGRVVRVEDMTTARPDAPADGDGPGPAERQAAAALYAGKAQTLWRLPLTATGSWAVCLPVRPPDGAAAPPWDFVSVAADAPTPPVSESLPVAGTPFTLHYGSDRAPGVKWPQINFAACGAEIPKGLKRIELEMEVAGTRDTATFSPKANARIVIPWSGHDVYGRPVAGRRPATVRIGYVYDSASPFPGECVLWRERRVMLGGWDARSEALGGWTLSVHHSYDPVGRVLYLGGGGRRDGADEPPTIWTVAGGTGDSEYAQDGQPATLANLNRPRGLAADPDGGLYIADAGQGLVRRVRPDGLIATVFGTRQQPLNRPTGLALGPDGALYVALDGDGRVDRLAGRKVDAVAGAAGADTVGIDPDRETPAAKTRMSHLRGLAVGPFGDLYLTQHFNNTRTADLNNNCVSRVDRSGAVSVFLGKPKDGTRLRAAVDVAVAPDGTVYAADADGCRVWRVAPDGAVSVAAGTGAPGFGGDGGPAVKARLNGPAGLALGPDGSLYIADARYGRVRRVTPDGIIDTVAGGGPADAPGAGDGGPAKGAALALYLDPDSGDVAGLVGLAVGPDGAVYVSDVVHGSVRRIAPAFEGISDSEILILSRDEKELYVFDGVGRHLQTLDAATGALVYRFVYDAAGRLTEVHDGAGAVTKVERKGGRPVALVAPGGERTVLETDADSRLTRVAPPSGDAAEMEYDAGGLLTSFKDGKGRAARYRYAEDGRAAGE